VKSFVLTSSNVLALNAFTTCICIFSESVFAEQKAGRIQVQIWFLLDTGCNLFLLHLRMKTMKKISRFNKSIVLVWALIARCFKELA